LDTETGLRQAKILRTFSKTTGLIHGVMYPMSRRIFQRDGVNRSHYSSIASFHHSNRTTLSLDPEVLEGRLSTGCERSELSSLFIKDRRR
jgi:hypothetical protein